MPTPDNSEAIDNPTKTFDGPPPAREEVDATIAQAGRPSMLDGDELPEVQGYIVQSEIARGAMGRILAAHDTSLDREVALKVLLPGADASRFVTESKVTAKLSHPGIPPVYQLGF